jgi:hypothetical protein
MFANDIWNLNVPSTENLVAYRDFFAWRMKEEPRVRFINASEGGILSEGAEVLTLRDALHQKCKQPIKAESILESRHRKQTVTLVALDRLRQVLSRQSVDSGCLDGYLELVAK